MEIKMSCQLPADCLNEIFEYLEDDRYTLHSCLLVNHLWCEISVRILWRNIWYLKSYYFKEDLFKASSSILSTLFACLPNESKELLHKNKIFISTPTSKSPLFNYAAFCKVLSIGHIEQIVNIVLGDNITLPKNPKNCLVIEEIINIFANQISSLKKLYYHYNYIDFSFPHFPGLRDLSELCCDVNVPSDFFHQLSQICHNLQTLTIGFCKFIVPNKLKELISLQKNLKILYLMSFRNVSWEDIIPSIENSNTITKLNLCGNYNLPILFVSSLSNLQELILSFTYKAMNFEDFKLLQYANFSKLHTLKIPYDCPKSVYMTKFLENNGKNLKKFYTSDKASSLSIAKFCPNLRSLFAIFNDGEVDVLRDIFINCKYLESIKIQWGKKYLTEKEVFETVTNYSPNNFGELKMSNNSNLDVSSEDLETFFINWKNRTPKKLLSLITIVIDVKKQYESLKIIEKYKNLGIIKFGTISDDEEEKIEDIIYGV
jgi:hypothetical protein